MDVVNAQEDLSNKRELHTHWHNLYGAHKSIDEKVEKLMREYMHAKDLAEAKL